MTQAEPHLTAPQRETLFAAVDRLLPAGDGPGAVEAGACEYIEETLAAPSASTIRPWIYRGLEDLTTRSNTRFGKDFAQCSTTEQDILLEKISADTHWATRLFIRSLIGLTLEGFLGDPKHGGNRQGMGWKFIGYDGDRIRSGFCLTQDVLT